MTMIRSRKNRMVRLEGLRTHDGRILPLNMKRWITRTVQRLELVLATIADIEARTSGKAGGNQGRHTPIRP